MSIGPYFNTYLSTEIILKANQMNNDIYKHLKNNLIDKIQGKCYMDYGFIVKIFQIEERSGGKIISEDAYASASYKIKFSCKICKPLKDSFICCEVVSINKSIVYLRNGPMYMLILEGYINTNNFIFDDNKNILLGINKSGAKIPIIQGTFVIAKITGTQIEDKSKRILMIGTLENIATDKEIKNNIELIEKDNKIFIDIDNYIDNNKEKQESKESEDNNESNLNTPTENENEYNEEDNDEGDED